MLFPVFTSTAATVPRAEWVSREANREAAAAEMIIVPLNSAAGTRLPDTAVITTRRQRLTN